MSASKFTAPSLQEMDELLSGYEFESELSSNEIGAVYYARQVSLDRYVAVKLFSKEKGNDDRFLASLKRSSTLVAGLKHPNLIGFIDSGMIEGMPFLVMEFVQGKSMHRSTHGHAIEFKQSMEILKQICEGMDYAHEHKVVHGNLSPLNILLNQQAVPKIGNFAMGRGIHTLPDVEVASHFSAPEVLQGEAHTVASDVYSLGAIFYELITATPYRQGTPRASELEGTPRLVDKVIEKACAADPAQRYGGAMEFYKALKKASTNAPKTPPAGAVASQRSKAMQMAMSTSGTGLWLKIVVIIVLLFTIKQVWNYRNAEKQRRELASSQEPETKHVTVSNYEMTKRQQQARIRQQQQQQEQAQQTQPEVFPDDPETPMESLTRLSDKLKEGDYSELPIGAATKSGRHYFLVEEAMTWQQAVDHARKLGGSIALPDGDMSWSELEPFAGKTAWVGAARSGSNAFTLLNARTWQPAGSVGGSASYVHLNGTGGFNTAPASTKLPYVIEWSEGAEPVSFVELMRACAKTIGTGQPVYPPGTVSAANRHYLPVAGSINWREAKKMAESAGGSLMVVSDDEEAAQLNQWSGQLSASSSYWLGGQLVGERWQWANGEPWRPVDWKSITNAAEDGAAMILRVGSGLDAMSSSATADGFIIEWSKDPETNKLAEGETPATLASPSELTEMAKQLVVKAIADKEAAHTKNTDKLAWDLDAHIRGLKKSDYEIWHPEAETLKTCVQNNRLLKETIDNSGAKLSPFMAKLCNYLLRKQDEIDEQHVKNLKAIHESYLKKLEEIHDQAKAIGQVKAQVAATELIEDSKNFDAWVTRMSAGAL